MTANMEFTNALLTKKLTVTGLTLLKEKINPDDEFLEEVLRIQSKRHDMNELVLEFISDAMIEYVLENGEFDWAIEQARINGVNNFHIETLKKIQTLTYPNHEKLDLFLDCCAA